MGKETKLGLAVIAVLVLIFGVVLVWRLTRSTPDVVAAAPKEKPAEKEKNVSKTKLETAESDTRISNAAPSDNRPTVLLPTVLPSQAARRAPEDVSSQWSTATDTLKKSSTSDSSTTASLTPGYAGSPPNSSAGLVGVAHLDAPADTRQPAPASAKVSSAHIDASVLVPAKDTVDPFQGHTNAYAAGSAQSTQGTNSLRTVDLSPPPPSTYAQSPRYASATAASASASAYSSSTENPYVASASVGQTGAGNFSPPTRNGPLQRATMDALQPTPGDSLRPTNGVAFRNSGSDGTHLDTDYTKPFGTENASHAGGSYEVQPNDNFWVISEKVYGSGAYFKALAEHNRGKVGQRDKLRVGDSIATPTIAQLEQTYPDLCPKPSRREAVRNRASLASTHSPYAGGRTYEVQEGDTLFDIARNELGKASRWAEIYDLNRDALGKDFDYLTPGMQLVLPTKDMPMSADKTTRRPGAGYDR